MASAVRFSFAVSPITRTWPPCLGHGCILAAKPGASHPGPGTAPTLFLWRSGLGADIDNRRKAIHDDYSANNGRMSSRYFERVCSDVQMIRRQSHAGRWEPSLPKLAPFALHTLILETSRASTSGNTVLSNSSLSSSSTTNYFSTIHFASSRCTD